MRAPGMRVAMLGNDYRFGFAPLAGDAEQPSEDQTIVDNPSVDSTALWTTGISATGDVLEAYINARYGSGDSPDVPSAGGTGDKPGEGKKWYQDSSTLTMVGVGAVVGLVVLSTAMKKSRRRR